VFLSRNIETQRRGQGLRGAIALVLVVGLPVDAHRRAYFISTCVFIIIVTNVGLGGLTVPAVKSLKIPNKLEGTLPAGKAALSTSEEELAQARIWAEIDRRYFVKWLRIGRPGMDKFRDKVPAIKQMAQASLAHQKAPPAAAPSAGAEKGGLPEQAYAPASALQIFKLIDIDRSGGLTFEEFAMWWRERQHATMGAVDEDMLGRGQQLFDEYDVDGSRTLSLGEFVAVLEELASDEWADAMDATTGKAYWYLLRNRIIRTGILN
jgi:hypothetical protein